MQAELLLASVAFVMDRCIRAGFSIVVFLSEQAKKSTCVRELLKKPVTFTCCFLFTDSSSLVADELIFQLY